MALDAKSGDEIWRFEHTRDSARTPLVADGALYFYDGESSVRKLDEAEETPTPSDPSGTNQGGVPDAVTPGEQEGGIPCLETLGKNRGAISLVGLGGIGPLDFLSLFSYRWWTQENEE